MKIRSGFVSNSSSSSFICEVCGTVYSGWDAGLEEAEMVECVKGHVFCLSCSNGEINWKKAIEERIKKEIKSYENDIKNKKMDPRKSGDLKNLQEDLLDLDSQKPGYKERESIPSEFCCICSLKEIKDETLLDYILKKTKVNKGNIIKEIRKQFKTLEEVDEFIRNKRN